jgi:hypothetical protein
MDVDLLDEVAADWSCTQVMRRHGKISASQIIYKGEIRMALLTKDENGNVVEVLESRPVSLEEIQGHIDNWTARKAEYLALTGQSDPSAPVDQPAAPVDAPTAPAAPSLPPVDPTQAPAAPVAPTDGSVPINPVDPSQQQAPVAPAAPVVDQATQAPVFPQ